MKYLIILISIILIGLSTYFYVKPDFEAKRKRDDYQAYQYKNLLDGINVQPEQLQTEEKR